MRKNRVEEQNQVAFVGYFRLKYPQYKYLITLPSFGENIGPRRMARLKQLGLTPGYPDLAIFIGRKNYYGLMIEMKTKFGRLQANQLTIHKHLTKQGYLVEVCHSWDEARKVTEEYLNGK